MSRPPAPIEAALYFCGMEAVQNAAKHSNAAAITVRLSEEQHAWRLVVTDNGTGFDRSEIGVEGGLMNLRDRLDSVRGTLTIESLVGAGTTVVAVVPRIQDTPADHGHTQVLQPVA